MPRSESSGVLRFEWCKISAIVSVVVDVLWTYIVKL